MPPKSSSKKEAVLWYLCEQCKVNITSKDRDQHEEHCPIEQQEADEEPLKPFLCSYIRDQRLFSVSLNAKPVTEELSDLSGAQLKGLVFLSESVINLCGFILGDFVSLSSPQLPEIAPVVRTVWPVPDRFLTTVFVTDEGK